MKDNVYKKKLETFAIIVCVCCMLFSSCNDCDHFTLLVVSKY